MTPSELNSIIQSDFKLWEKADTVQDGGTITKRLVLPHGIGDFQISFEGVNNAEGRRNAAAVWGDAVRNEVDNKIGDESVTARAAQRAAQAGEDTSRYTGPGEPDKDDAGPEEVSAKDSVQTHGEVATFSTDPSDRYDELVRYRGQLADKIKGLDIEIKALGAYMEVLNAQEDSETQASSEAAED